jgi:hypothetical protein
MFRTFRTFALSLAALAGCADLDVNTESTEQATHSWGSYHWARTANPFTVKLGDNVTAAWDSYLATASADWTASSVLNTTIVAGSTTGATCAPTAGRVQVCNSTYGSTGWLGIASIWANSSSHITQATVKLNDTYFNTATYNTPAWRALVTCQEVGHTFGLAHQDENFTNANLGTCMDYTNNPSTNQHPNAHDYNQLVTIYSHLDSSTTVGLVANTTEPATTADNDESPAEWGEMISSSANGHGTMYIRATGPDEVKITHVFWIEGRQHYLPGEE